jgi:hypothetical protein
MIDLSITGIFEIERSHFLGKLFAHIIRFNNFAVFGIGHNLAIEPKGAANFADNLTYGGIAI